MILFYGKWEIGVSGHWKKTTGLSLALTIAAFQHHTDEDDATTNTSGLTTALSAAELVSS